MLAAIWLIVLPSKKEGAETEIFPKLEDNALLTVSVKTHHKIRKARKQSAINIEQLRMYLNFFNI